MGIMEFSIVICGILGLIVGIIYMTVNGDNAILGFIFCGLGGGLIGLIAGSVLGFITNAVVIAVVDPEQEYVYVYNQKIKGLQDSTALDGTFILGTGTLDEDMTYYFMKEENGGWRMSNRKASDLLIREIENTEQPKIVREREVFTDEKWHKALMDSNALRDVLYVPKDTISKEYNIDMK